MLYLPNRPRTRSADWHLDFADSVERLVAVPLIECVIEQGQQSASSASFGRWARRLGTKPVHKLVDDIAVYLGNIGASGGSYKENNGRPIVAVYRVLSQAVFVVGNVVV